MIFHINTKGKKRSVGRSSAPKNEPSVSSNELPQEQEERSESAALNAIPKPLRSGILAAFLREISELKLDIASIRERDPAATSNAEVLLLYPGVHAVAVYRVAHALHGKDNKTARFTAKALSTYARRLTGIEIHPAAKIGRRFFIDHGTGVVIGETAVIGDDCTVYQGVTLGGTGKHVGKRHPTIGNNVMIGAGAKVLGPLTVGDNSKIAAGAVVLIDIPEDCTAVGVPARIVRQNNKKTDALDQIHIPDPISRELCRQLARIERLEREHGIVQKTSTDDPLYVSYESMEGI